MIKVPNIRNKYGQVFSVVGVGEADSSFSNPAHRDTRTVILEDANARFLAVRESRFLDDEEYKNITQPTKRMFLKIKGQHSSLFFMIEGCEEISIDFKEKGYSQVYPGYLLIERESLGEYFLTACHLLFHIESGICVDHSKSEFDWDVEFRKPVPY